MSTPYTAPVVDLRGGVDYVTAAQLQAAMDALAWRDGTSVIKTYQQSSTSNLVVTTTAADLPGATISITPAKSGAVALVTTVFSFNPGGSTAVGVGLLNVDGADQGRQCIKDLVAAQNQHIAQFHRIVLSAGAHTLKLRASRTNSSGLVTCFADDSYIAALVIDNN